MGPKRVYALIVGVESYQVSAAWNLPGAARDALRFAAWLTGPGEVPASNVRMFVSALPQASLGKELEGVPAATQENVERALFDELPHQDGDLLWFFWAGHGFLDDRNQLLLPYSDATGPRTRHLNLESALRRWMTTHVPRGRFGRQVVIGDACRVHDRPASKLSFDRCDYGRGDAVVERRQFVLYAARPGEAAQNLNERSAGRFTDLLLDRLQTRTLDQSVADLVDIAREVQADFHGLRENGLAWQQPHFLIDRDWTGSTLFGYRWEGVSPGSVLRLDQLAWDQLGPILKQRPLPPYTYDAYRWAFAVAGCVPPNTAFLPAGSLTELVRDLDSRQGRESMPLALPFLRYVAARVDDRRWATELESWVGATCQRLNTTPLPTPPDRAPEPMALHIQLTPSTEDRVYGIRMWLHRDRFEFVREADRPVNLDGVREEVGRQLSVLCGRQALQAVRRVEFHIPFELLHEEFEQWTAPIGRHGKEKMLGRHFEVVVCCPDERTGVAGDHWLRKWQWFTANGGNHPEAIRLLSEGDTSSDLHVADPPVCVLAGVSAEHIGDVLDDVLDGGVPIAVWYRDDQQGGLGDVLLGSANDLHELPATVYQRRNQNHRIALLWDDPARRPDSRSLA